MEHTTTEPLHCVSEMEKAYKIALEKLQAWKISRQNMYKKCKKLCKNAKNLTQMQTSLKKRMIAQKLAQLFKISKRGASAASTFFHLCWISGWKSSRSQG